VAISESGKEKDPNRSEVPKRRDRRKIKSKLGGERKTMLVTNRKDGRTAIRRERAGRLGDRGARWSSGLKKNAFFKQRIFRSRRGEGSSVKSSASGRYRCRGQGVVVVVQGFESMTGKRWK